MSHGMIPEGLFRIRWGSDARLLPDGWLVDERIGRINGLYSLAQFQEGVLVFSSSPFTPC
jgi:hypothetical protein